MDKIAFNITKKKLIGLIRHELDSINSTKVEKRSMENLLKLLEAYSYENRLEMKGLLARTIIDSLELDYLFGQKFIEFDNNIS